MKKSLMVSESELDYGQIEVLNAILDKSCIVSGCAGSGKTILALLKALRVQKERPQSGLSIIVFTKALHSFLKASQFSNEEQKETVEALLEKVKYYEEWRWEKGLKRYANGQIFEVYKRDENGERIPNMPQVDYTIVDEIQDFSQNEIIEFLNATNNHVFFFGDTDQSIYAGLKETIPVKQLKKLLVNNGRKAKFFELYYNYRLPIPIAKYVQHVGVNLPPLDISKYKSKEKEKPFVLKYESEEDEMEAIQAIIQRRQLTDVAILLPSNELVKMAGDCLSSLGMNVEMKYEDRENFKNNKNNLHFSSDNPKIMTYHSAKGLQFEAVFLPFIECFGTDNNDNDRKALYVAMTRTNKYLFIMYDQYLPSILNRIPKGIYNTEEQENIDEI